jgi:hypothetical protein
MTNRLKWTLRLGITIGLGICGNAAAEVQYVTSYTATLNTGQPVTNIMLLEEGEGFGSSAWAFSMDGQGTSTLTNPFPTTNIVQRSLLIGIVADLVTDPAAVPSAVGVDQKHIVLFMDDNAAALSNHIAWGTLFRNTLEEQLIADLELATSGQDWPIIQPGLDGVDAFTQGDAKTGILAPGGIPTSAWFATGGTFTVMSWSDGTVVGSGTSQMTQVPEPASLALCLVAAAFLQRRRR